MVCDDSFSVAKMVLVSHFYFEEDKNCSQIKLVQDILLNEL